MTSILYPTAEKPLRIGTRQSPLAMAQAHMVADALLAVHDLPEDAVRIIPMLSGGDKVQDRPLAEIGGKALWTKELERALIEDEIDAAVHSMKDVETVRPNSFAITAMLPRADVRDRLVGAESIAGLPQGATIGTSSPRRAAQLLSLRPDLNITSLRGNVATRLSKIEAGDADATLLAAAGLNRLGMEDTGSNIEIDEMLPAASQGAIGIDCLTNDENIRKLLSSINDQPTFNAVMAERGFLEELGGDCHSPVAAYASTNNGKLIMRGEIFREDGSEKQSGEIDFDICHKEAPAKLARQLLDQASAELRALFSK